jgi:hypothetical protein
MQKVVLEKPWIVYVPLWIQWIILNFAGPGAWIGPTVLRQLLSGPRTDVNIVFPVTWTSAVVSFLVIILLLRKRTSIFHAISISAASQFGAAFLFEFVFSIIAFVMYGHPVLQGNLYYVLAGISWLVMPLCGVGYWARNKVLWLSIGVFVVGFSLWILIGFPILNGATSIILNFITKLAAFSITTAVYVDTETKNHRKT